MCPFHYFGIYDPTEIDQVAWKRGGYDTAVLSGIYTGNDARTRIILKELADKVDDVHDMRALGFCQRRARKYMAERFNYSPASARAVSRGDLGGRPAGHLRQLRDRELERDLRCRPVQRGAGHPERRHRSVPPPHRECHGLSSAARSRPALGSWQDGLDTLDFVGHQRKEFRFDQRFRALTGLSRKELIRQADTASRFYLQLGSQIVYWIPVAREGWS